VDITSEKLTFFFHVFCSRVRQSVWAEESTAGVLPLAGLAGLGTVAENSAAKALG
jgi:hypothetical protein